MTAAVPALISPPLAGRRGRLPAPMATILAVLGRVASHAGDPQSITVTEHVHAINVNTADPEQHTAWCREVSIDGPVVEPTRVGPFAESTAALHGWLLTISVTCPR